jgi:tetratricopeptide (TPR) repeat protein
MKMKYLIFFAMILMALTNLAASPLSDNISLGDSLYETNDYPGSIAAYKNALTIDSLSAEANWKLARSLNLQAELEPKDKQLTFYEQAAIVSRRCTDKDSLIAEGHFQLARAQGRVALFKGVFKSASLAKQVKREADKTLVLDPKHDGAYHILGRWNREVAQKPKFLRSAIGLGEADKKIGIECFQKAIELNPNYINHHLEYGISLLDMDQKDEAKAEFELCLTLPALRPLDLKYQNEAKDYLARLTQKN